MAADTYTVERSLTINAAAEHIYDQIADFHRWTRWSPWEDLDPALERGYFGAESGIGAVYAWSGNRKAGQGRMEITDASRPSAVQVDLLFEKPFKARNTLVFTIVAGGSQSRVTWSMTGRKTVMTKVMGIFRSMDKMIGPDFEKGLSRLKATTEQSSA
jgi:polyketide cyclase/dehydrase/lipid transport protein